MNCQTEQRIENELRPASLASRRPRLLYVVTRAERGGAQTHVLDVASSLRDEFDITIATGEEGFLTDASRERGIPVRVLPHLQREVSPLRDAAAFWELLTLIKQVQPDLIHAHTFKAGFLGRLAGRFLGIPSIYTIHAWLYGTPAVSRMCSALSGPCERAAANWCESIITVSDAGARIIQDQRIGNRSKLVTIHNGISDTPERARPDREQPPVITMVSRFIEGKDHDLLLHAFAESSADATLRLVGDGPRRPVVESLARELGIAHKVEFLGNRSDVPAILANTDVFVLASQSEMLPISILEAMRAGLPVIASDVGGVSEAVADGETGLLVPRGSVPALAGALKQLSSDRAMRKRLGNAGRGRFLDQFTSTRMVERTRDLYLKVLSAKDEPVRDIDQIGSLSPTARWQLAQSSSS